MPQTSSKLSSSSKYLNNAALRDWCAKEMLRKNGADLPPPAGAYQVIQILSSLTDLEHVENLFVQERRKNALVDAWFERRHIPSFTKDDLRKYPPQSVGRLLLAYIERNNFELDISPPFEPRSHAELYMRMRSRQHDLEHILTGGGFDYMGELVPYYMNLTQMFRFFSPELAGYLSQIHIFGSLRYTVRTLLHYPKAWPTAMQSMLRGIRIGKASEPFFTFKYEDVFELPVAAARRKLGVREAIDCDTSEISWYWGSDSHRTLVAASKQ